MILTFSGDLSLFIKIEKIGLRIVESRDGYNKVSKAYVLM
jgi:hypothetical protein